MTSTAPLDSDFLSDVLECLWHMRHKWHNLGLALRMDPIILDHIKKLYPDDVDSCFRELMRRWLASSGHEASWSTLTKALVSPLVRAVIQQKGYRTIVYTNQEISDIRIILLICVLLLTDEVAEETVVQFESSIVVCLLLLYYYYCVS